MLKRVSSIITFISFFITFITFADVVEISSWAELAAINSALDGDYVLVVDLSSQTEGYSTYAGQSANGGDGWLPIGNCDNRFVGTFNGNGHTISDLYIDRPTTDYIGLFGAIFTNANIHDIRVLDATITGHQYVGVLVGGVAIALPVPNNMIIYNCATSGTVSGTDWVGGLAGGLVYGITCQNSYSYTNVTATTGAGGFAGAFSSVASATNCFSYGSVSAPTKNGFAGSSSSSGTITRCYWDIESSGCSTSDLGTGKTTAQMKNITTFAIQPPTHTGIVDVNSDHVIRVSGDAFDTAWPEGSKITIDGVEYTIDYVESGDLLYILEDGGIKDDVAYSYGGETGGYDITTIENFDPNNPTIWFIDDGNDYPRLWYEWTGGGGGGETIKRRMMGKIDNLLMMGE